jgi:hypothetical protein
MKTSVRLFISILIVSLVLSTSSYAQEKYSMVELTFILPKIGMENAFEQAVKTHNKQFHSDGASKAHLDYIMTGKQAGWYVWLMGPCTFTDLDSRPDSDTHNKEWEQNVATKIAKYGSVEYWKHNPKWSFSSGSETAKLEEIWFFGVKSEDYYKFNDLMVKVVEAFKKQGTTDIQVYQNQFREDNNRDVAIVWGMNSWADMDKDDDGIKKYYEEINGEDSWANFLDEWFEVTHSVVSQVWKINI